MITHIHDNNLYVVADDIVLIDKIGRGVNAPLETWREASSQKHLRLEEVEHGTGNLGLKVVEVCLQSSPTKSGITKNLASKYLGLILRSC